MKKLMLFVLPLGVLIALSAALLSPTVHASDSCMTCTNSGHGGGTGCVLPPAGTSNPKGCFCLTNPKTHLCYMTGNPCTCDVGDPPLCDCNSAAAPKKPDLMAPTEENIKREYTKWYAEFTSGGYRPGQNIIIHAAKPPCLSHGGAFIIGISMAAAMSGHSVKFNIGDPAKVDSAQDRIDQGLNPDGTVPSATKEVFPAHPFTKFKDVKDTAFDLRVK